MLGKLIKYNLKPIFKSILPFMVLLLASVILFNVSAYEVEFIYNEQGNLVDVLPPEIQQFIHGLANLMISCSCILLLASTVRVIWRRFKANLYSDEAYLTYTLPISRRTLWNSQICSTIITLASIIIFLVLNCLLLALTRDGQQILQSLGLIGGCSHCVGAYHYIEPLSLIHYLSFAFAVFTELAFIVLCGFLGIIISNRLSKNISLIIGAGVYLVGGLILIGIFCLIPDLLNNLQNIPVYGTPDQNTSISPITNILICANVVYACYCIVLYFVGQKLFNRGVNLD